MTRSRMYIMVPLISHFRKETIRRNARITAMLSRANATIDHFRNAGGSPSIFPVTGYDLDRRDKKSTGFYKTKSDTRMPGFMV
jgi:hypothetical protein